MRKRKKRTEWRYEIIIDCAFTEHRIYVSRVDETQVKETYCWIVNHHLNEYLIVPLSNYLNHRN